VAVGDVPKEVRELVSDGLAKRRRRWSEVGFVATVAIEPGTQWSPSTEDLGGTDWLVVLDEHEFPPGSVVRPVGEWSFVVKQIAIPATGELNLSRVRVYEKAAVFERPSPGVNRPRKG